MLGTDQSSGNLPSEKWRLAARSTARQRLWESLSKERRSVLAGLGPANASDSRGVAPRQ